MDMIAQQVEKKTKIYFPPQLGPEVAREFLLLEQGLIENKRVELVEDEASFDFIFAHYCPWLNWARDHPNMKLDPAKLIFIDYGDPASRMFPVECKAYFKRSWTVRPKPDDFSIRVPLSFPDNYHPINHAIMDQFSADLRISAMKFIHSFVKPGGYLVVDDTHNQHCAEGIKEHFDILGWKKSEIPYGKDAYGYGKNAVIYQRPLMELVR